MEQIEILYRLWPIFIFIIGGFAWLLKLEARTITLEKELTRHLIVSEADMKQMGGQIHNVADQLTEIKITLARIEERFKIYDKQETKGG